MDKRQFLIVGGGTLGAALPPQAQAAASTARTGPGLLTVTGAITRSNRGPLDPALDQLMLKHGATFDQAWEFDAAMLARLPSLAFQPTLEYDARPHRLRGPLLSSVLGAAGVVRLSIIAFICLFISIGLSPSIPALSVLSSLMS